MEPARQLSRAMMSQRRAAHSEAFSLRFAQGGRGAERLVPALRSATGEPGTRDGSPFGGPLSAALGSRGGEQRGTTARPGRRETAGLVAFPPLSRESCCWRRHGKRLSPPGLIQGVIVLQENC